jgi:hypothetical protein
MLHGDLDRARSLIADAHEIFRTLDARPRIADCIEAFAGVAAADGEWRESAQLLGAADELRRVVGAVRQPDQGRWVASFSDDVRNALGADAFDEQFAVGRTLDAAAVAR